MTLDDIEAAIVKIISRLDVLDGGIPQIPIKFCVDCKQYGGMATLFNHSQPEHQCNCLGETKTHPVTGKFYTDLMHDTSAAEMRWNNKKCGMSAKWFEPK